VRVTRGSARLVRTDVTTTATSLALASPETLAACDALHNASDMLLGHPD
jgi:hypothetical protein